LTPYKISALIPARGGSKGVPRKNIKEVGGYPLLAYSIAACKLSKHIGDIFVSTEDLEIANVAKKYGAIIPFMRPTEYASDSSTDCDVLKHFFDHVKVDDIAFIRPTTPFRSPDFMDSVIDRYFEVKSGVTGLRTVHEINENPYKVFKIENNICRGFFPDFNGIEEYTNLPRQTFPTAYVGNGYLDIVKKETVLKGTTFGKTIHAEVCEKIIDIDSFFDLKLANLAVSSGDPLINNLITELNQPRV
jgi:CMP-N,N'-diacetyllegionaminic acid synthase